MKALVYDQAHAWDQFSLEKREVPDPEVGPLDLLVRVCALSVNPVDYKIRQSRNASGRPVILGWDASGVVVGVGELVSGFRVGDEVFYAGDLNRDGCYAELQAVDHRLVALKPQRLGFAQAAALPLTSLTAWELLRERIRVQDLEEPAVLVLGAAGGVGSVAIQLLKDLGARVIATASRPATQEWCLGLGADVVIDHREDLRQQLDAIGQPHVDVVLGLSGTQEHQAAIPGLLRPFGHFGLIDDPATLDVVPFKSRSLSVHWELMFTKSLFQTRESSQGQILSQVAQMVAEGRLRTTIHRELVGLEVEILREAHGLLESGGALGKTVVRLESSPGA